MRLSNRDEFIRLAAIETDDCVLWTRGQAQGYGVLIWDGVAGQVHRLVCTQRHGPPPLPGHSMHAAHICGVTACMNYRHLRWATPRENAADCLIHGTRRRGETQRSNKLSETDVRAIRRRVATGARQKDLAQEYGVTHPTISTIVHYKTWGWLDADPSTNQAKEKAQA